MQKRTFSQEAGTCRTMMDSYASGKTVNIGHLCLRGDVHPERDNVEHRHRKIHLCCQRVNIMKQCKIGDYDEISFGAAVEPCQQTAQVPASFSNAQQQWPSGCNGQTECQKEPARGWRMP